MAFTEAVTYLKDPDSGKEIVIESACQDKTHFHEQPRKTSRRHGHRQRNSWATDQGGPVECAGRRCEGRTCKCVLPCRCGEASQELTGCNQVSCAHGACAHSTCGQSGGAQSFAPANAVCCCQAAATPTYQAPQYQLPQYQQTAYPAPAPPASILQPITYTQPLPVPAAGTRLIPVYRQRKAGGGGRVMSGRQAMGPTMMPMQPSYTPVAGYPGVQGLSGGVMPLQGAANSTYLTMSIPGRGQVHVPCFF